MNNGEHGQNTEVLILCTYFFQIHVPRLSSIIYWLDQLCKQLDYINQNVLLECWQPFQNHRTFEKYLLILE